MNPICFYLIRIDFKWNFVIFHGNSAYFSLQKIRLRTLFYIKVQINMSSAHRIVGFKQPDNDIISVFRLLNGVDDDIFTVCVKEGAFSLLCLSACRQQGNIYFIANLGYPALSHISRVRIEPVGKAVDSLVTGI